MVFKKLLGSLGFGGPTVDTVLSTPTVTPGGPLQGQVYLQGGGSDTDIESITVILTATAGGGAFDVARIPVAGRFTLPAGAAHAVPLQAQTPWETPITLIYGQPLPGITMGVRTQVDVRGGSGKTDLDPIAVSPLDAHNHLLDALGNLGCRFIRADLRPGQQVGLAAPVVQRVTFYAPADGRQPGAHLPQLSLNLVANSHALDIALETGWASPPSHYTLAHTDAGGDLTSLVGGWVREAVARVPQHSNAPGAFMQPPVPPQGGYAPRPGYGQGYAQPGYGPGYAQPAYGYGRSGPGMGSMIGAGVGGAALGFLGGMVMGEMIEGAMQPDVTENVTENNYYDNGGADQGTNAAYDGGYDQGGNDQGGYDQGGYENASYDQGGYDQSGYDAGSGAGDFADYGGDYADGGFDGGDFGGGDF
jgi:sporulation-control protein